jgi:hypothetical protein
VTRKCDGLNESTDKYVLPKVLVDGDRSQRVGQQAGALHILFPNLPKTPKMDHELIKLVNKLQDTFNNLGAQFDFSGISGNKL